MTIPTRLLLLACITPLCAAPQWVFVADDQNTYYREGVMGVREGARVGAVSAFDFSTFPPKAWHMDNVPCSVVGPPAAIAGNGAGKVLVTQSMKVDPADPTKLTGGNLLTLLAVCPEKGFKVLDQQEVGLEPTAVVFAPGGERAYVAVRREGIVARYKIDGDKLVLEGKQKIAEPDDNVSMVAISPDGKTALASLHTRPAILVFDVQADGSLKEIQTLPTPNNVYDIHFIHGGQRALISCTLVNIIATLEKGKDGQWGVSSVEKNIGRIAEGLEVSPDEKWISVSCFDGANTSAKDKKWYGQPGRVYMFELGKDGNLSGRQPLDVGGVQQAAGFSPDGKYVLAGRFGLGDLAVYKLEDGSWVNTGATFEIPGQCASMFTEK